MFAILFLIFLRRTVWQVWSLLERSQGACYLVHSLVQFSEGHIFNTLEVMYLKNKKIAGDLKDQQLVLAFDLFNSLIKRVIPASIHY